MLQAIHHVNLELDVFALLSVGHGDEFCRQTQTRGLLLAFVNCSEFASKQSKPRNEREKVSEKKVEKSRGARSSR